MGSRSVADDETAMIETSGELFERFGRPILLKGGHLARSPDRKENAIPDVLRLGSDRVEVFVGERVRTDDDHGTGCSLSSAIATLSARGYSPRQACSAACAWVRNALSASRDGFLTSPTSTTPRRGPLNHLRDADDALADARRALLAQTPPDDGARLVPDDVLNFWLLADPRSHFTANPFFDAEISNRFGDLLRMCRDGERDLWLNDDRGILATVIVLDQFSRNVHRGTPKAFAADDLARRVADRALADGLDSRLEASHASWLYMPFMHSEELADQERCVELFRRRNLAEGLPHAEEHRDIIKRFGRFPHRNSILGRQSSAEERKFLADGGFSG